MSLAVRALAEEQMDAEDLSAGEYAAIIGDLARANRWTMAARPTLSFIARAAKDRPFRLLDVGFGHGDMLRRIAGWAERRGQTCELVGVDLNPRSEPAARAATPPHMPIRYRTGDYVELAGEPWDLIVSSLVAHHMTHDQLIAFLRFMDATARMGWLVNDLHRHALPHVGFPILARAMRWHRIVREDGTLSIARSYRPAEWPPILDEAGVAARIYRAFPFRLCVEKIR
ncbi:methyltransferase domain-containing protein [Sphingomonas sp. MAH-20]|jgi:SAM-dependent methyltransferase|uniref:Methyltransferase domain-containing protein n=1 Tax=Sphingomonas horti TaxID=2682842 RepID=A0A6I4IXK7_9SPHN|nr:MULTISPECIES: methyltransferase domain-containing protein [Sphingomonas]MBA2920903.1 methyltransferase domain-containing protein [Sphingomonas sp. CGMCC 1.13658]MVO76889.1 methyltransferase domain-containing protein [Sphingomonas horti]